MTTLPIFTFTNGLFVLSVEVVEMRIELDLTDDEKRRLLNMTALEAAYTDNDLNHKIARAIERAESFVDDNDDEPEMPLIKLTRESQELSKDGYV
jgi:hypothetical protein